MKTRICLTGLLLWRAEHKVQSLFGRIPRNGREPRQGCPAASHQFFRRTRV